jgi:hypothetical protein
LPLIGDHKTTLVYLDMAQVLVLPFGKHWHTNDIFSDEEELRLHLFLEDYASCVLEEDGSGRPLVLMIHGFEDPYLHIEACNNAAEQLVDSVMNDPDLDPKDKAVVTQFLRLYVLLRLLSLSPDSVLDYLTAEVVSWESRPLQKDLQEVLFLNGCDRGTSACDARAVVTTVAENISWGMMSIILSRKRIKKVTD